MRKDGCSCTRNGCASRISSLFLPDQENPCPCAKALGGFSKNFRSPLALFNKCRFLNEVEFQSQREIRIDSLWVSIKQRIQLRASKRWCCVFVMNTRASLGVSRTVVAHFPNSLHHTFVCVQKSLFWMDVMRETKVEANSCPKSFSRRKIAFSSESLLRANEFKFASNLFCFGAGVWIFVKKNHFTTRITLVCVTLFSFEEGSTAWLTHQKERQKKHAHWIIQCACDQCQSQWWRR